MKVLGAVGRGALALGAAAAGLIAALPLAQPAVAVTTPITRTQSTVMAGYDFANYIAVPGAVSAIFIVPRLSCKTSPVGSALYVGVGIQSVSSSSRLYMVCGPRGVAHYYPSILLNGTARNIPSHLAQPGDRVEVALSQSDAIVTCSVIDLTHKFTTTINGSGSGTSEGVLAGDFPAVTGSTASPVPNFGSIAFSSALINGYPFGAAATGLQVDNLGVASTGPVQIATTYSATNKETFVTTFKHS
jgi:hypothetical protein